MKNKKTEVITIRTTPEVKTILNEIAEREDRSIAYIVNKIVEEWIKSNPLRASPLG